MQLTISDQDFTDALGAQGVRRITEKKTELVLGPESTRSGVIDAMPRVISERIKKMIPEEFELHEIEIKVSFAGTPFGVGVGGEATVTFGPKAK